MYRESLARYFLRAGVKLPDEINASAELLFELHKGHCMKIPVENLDAVNGVPSSLDPGDVYRKVMDKKRGGNCFELNLLFGWLLRELGYGVEDRAARYLKGEGGYPMRNHSVLLATDREGTVWCCDVGSWDDSPLLPLRLEEDTEQKQGSCCFRFRRHRFLGWRLQSLVGEDWEDIYSFTDEPQLPQDFIPLSHYMNTGPDSPYASELRVSLKTETGRLALQGSTLAEYAEDRPIAIKECEDEDLPRTLSRFGLKL